ncbi:PaaI family thioesterase [Jannaschia sp. 2305UL9-9]|uniref:PaaI family thioesterase n=1 Tax=Jannaschia sp. 2305UL9-9 TaxID=3121638 RepID=UPI003529700C
MSDTISNATRLGRDEVLALSGLQFMQGILDGTVPPPPIAGVLNYRVSRVADGRVVFDGTPLAQHCNPLGTVHGGWYGTLLDSAMSCAVHTKVPAGSIYTTLEYKVNVTRAIPVGMAVTVEGVVQHAGRTTGVATGAIRGVDDGRIYATGSATCLIMTG